LRPLAPSGRLRLLMRPECGLCEEFAAAYHALARHQPLPPLELTDVDSDATLSRRWGLKIPVLLLDDTLVCQTRLDAGELLRLLRL
jgi:Glutaredoxin-like domain (DUF836)